MMRAFAILVFVAMVSATGSAARADVSLLREALANEYPGVVQWHITPLRDDDDVRLTRVVKLGVRSAALDEQGTVRWYSVEGRRPVVIVTSAIGRGDNLDAQHVATDSRNVVGLTCQPLTDVDHISETRAARSLQTGDILCGDATETLPDVVSGARVVVRASVGGVTVVSKAKALGDADHGELVRVRNVNSRISFMAQVVGTNEVLVNAN